MKGENESGYVEMVFRRFIIIVFVVVKSSGKIDGGEKVRRLKRGFSTTVPNKKKAG